MSSITLARVYRRSFEAYPHRTLAVAGGALTALGDAVAQLSQQIVRFRTTHALSIALRPFYQITPEDEHRRGFHYDVVRTLRFFCFGAGVSECPCNFSVNRARV
jgi:protein Mpv17